MLTRGEFLIQLRQSEFAHNIVGSLYWFAAGCAVTAAFISWMAL